MLEKKLLHFIEQKTGSNEMNIVRYNDAPETTFEDIKELCLATGVPLTI